MLETDESVILPMAPEEVAREDKVVDQDVFGAINALWESGVPKKVIARELDLDIKTVRKWLREPWREQSRQSSAGILDAYKLFLDRRAPEVGYNGEVLLRELCEQGYSGSYATVWRHVKQLREQARQSQLATVRFETEPGKQAQVDWGQSTLFMALAKIRVHFFVMVLGYSRRIFARAFADEKLESLLEGHALAFEHFGGRTTEILYDNPRTIVTSRSDDGLQVQWNGRFKDCMDFYGATVRLCRYYRPRTKGKVESGVKYVKRNALAGRSFASMEELNAHLQWWCLEVADLRIHGTTHEQPMERFLRDEQAKMIAVVKRVPAALSTVMTGSATRCVTNDAFVVIDTNRYPVDYSWVGATVAVGIESDKVLLRRGNQLVEHSRLAGKHRVAHWDGAARRLPGQSMAALIGPPSFEPTRLQDVGEVEVRSLACYSELCEEVQG